MSKSAPGSVTVRREVAFFTTNGKSVFSVNEGIPLADAFDQLSLLLRNAQQAVEDLAVADDEGMTAGARWTPAHLLNFAHALVQSMHAGHLAGEK